MGILLLHLLNHLREARLAARGRVLVDSMSFSRFVKRSLSNRECNSSLLLLAESNEGLNGLNRLGDLILAGKVKAALLL